MSLLPKMKYGSVEVTKVIDPDTTGTRLHTFHDGKETTAEKMVIRHRNIVYKADASNVPEIMQRVFCDPTKLNPKVYTEYLKPSGDYYHLIEEYTVIDY